MSIEQISELTDRQYHDIICHPRDEQGQVIPPREEPPDWSEGLSEKEQDYIALFEFGRQVNAPEEYLRQQWAIKYGPDDKPWESK